MTSINEQLETIRRGTVEIILEEDLENKLKKSAESGKPLIVKQGFDPTKPDIHLGHTVGIRKLAQMQDMGHQIVFLIGDFTAMIGDPSGRSEIRTRMTKKEVVENAQTYAEQVSALLDLSKIKIEYNSKWCSKMGFEDVLELASQYTVARMLERDDFEKRYKSNQPISILEFLYPLIQGYDSVALKADIELGGNDQKFNLLVGREIQKAYGMDPQVIITMPLLVGTDGIDKMSKSLDNYIGINEPPNEMFGKIMSIPDSLLYDYFVLLTDLPMDELDSIKRNLETGDINPMIHKKRLAREIIDFYHSPEAAAKAQEEFERVFSQKGLPDEIATCGFHSENNSVWIIKMLTESGLCSSNGEARRMIKQGAVSIDGEKVESPEIDIDISFERLVKVGKRKFMKVVASS
ncbi:MAG: tyrosine--tRNA ligase [candidate division Zixibacteria bacterium]|nr:tyrosine--tRNA ligase [candidate division Zixibacteria bacterium]